MPEFRSLRAVLIPAALAVAAATPAFAVTTTTVVVTDGGKPVPRSKIQIVNTKTGETIPLEDGSKDGCIVVSLPAGTYVVKFDGQASENLTVDGTGAERFNAGIGEGGEGGVDPCDMSGGPTRKRKAKTTDQGRG